MTEQRSVWRAECRSEHVSGPTINRRLPIYTTEQSTSEPSSTGSSDPKPGPKAQRSRLRSGRDVPGQHNLVTVVGNHLRSGRGSGPGALLNGTSAREPFLFASRLITGHEAGVPESTDCRAGLGLPHWSCPASRAPDVSGARLRRLERWSMLEAQWHQSHVLRFT